MGKTALGCEVEKILTERNLEARPISRKIGLGSSTLAQIINGHSRMSVKVAVLFGDEMGIDPAALLAIQTREEIERVREELGKCLDT